MPDFKLLAKEIVGRQLSTERLVQDVLAEELEKLYRQWSEEFVASALGLRKEVQIAVGICREDNPQDVDEAYGQGTYARIFPDKEDSDEPSRV